MQLEVELTWSLKFFRIIFNNNLRYLPSIIFKTTYSKKTITMMMNKNTVLGYATLIMIVVGLILIGLGAFRYDDVAGWGFAAVGIGFFAIAWVFNALKGRV